MPMRQDCVYFESRTYPNGDTVRKCNLDLAPEAPWRCPDDCPKFAKRRGDVNWSYGTLVTPKTPDEPDGEGIAELLNEAENIVNSAGSDIVSDLEDQRRRDSGRWGRLKARFRRKT